MTRPGARVVCVPGLGLRRSSWQPVLDIVEESAQTVLLPGFGVPAAPGRDLRPESLGEVLAEQSLQGHPPCVLLAHSASCQVVVHAARSAPDSVLALVLVGPTTDPRATSWPALAMRWLRTAIHEQPSQVPVLAQSYRRTGLRSMARAMEAARHHDLRPALAGLGAPVLVVRGRHDRICPEDWAAEVVGRTASGSVLETLPMGAHMVPLTHASAVADAVTRFREGVGV